MKYRIASCLVQLWLQAGVLRGLAASVTPYPYGAQLDNTLITGDDVTSPAIALAHPIVFYGNTYHRLYVNSNGVLSFNGPFLDFTEETNAIHMPYVTAFWDDIDIRNGGTVYYRVDTSPDTMAKAKEDILKAGRDIDPVSVFVATWHEVAQYDPDLTERNSFQVVLITDGERSYVMLHYMDITWAHKGTAAVNSGGPGGTVVNVPGSGDPDKMVDLSSYSNVCMPGRVVIQLDPDPVDFLHCCSVTFTGLVTTFDGVQVPINAPGKVPLATAKRSGEDPCVFLSQAVMTGAGNGVKFLYADMDVGVHPGSASKMKRIYSFGKSGPGTVLERGPLSAKAVVPTPWYYPQDGSNVAITKHDSAFYVTSKLCPYSFYYGPGLDEPVLKIIVGDYFSGITKGMCQNADNNPDND